MSEYKKEPPENTSGSMTHSVGKGREPDIEWHLAEILNLVQTLKPLAQDYCPLADIMEGLDEITERVRKTWDLVPDDDGWDDGNRCACSKNTYHCDCSPVCCYCNKDKNESQTGKADATLQQSNTNG